MRRFPSKFRLFKCLVLVAALTSFVVADAEAKDKRHHRPARTHRAALVDSGARYADLVIEAGTGRILHAVNADQLRHPASLTKMMTLYVAFQALESGRVKIDQRLPVSNNAASQSPSKLGLRAGQTIRVGDAILGLVTESANDAAVVLAEGLGGSEDRFAEMMTRQARALGMKRTVFRNPSGLPDPEQVTTAHDMALLGYALVRHYPQFYPYFSNEQFSYAGATHRNHNHLMERYDGMDGIKTGYIRASGFNLVASAVRGNTRLIGVVFGGRSAVSRDNQMAELLDQGFAAAPEAGRIIQAHYAPDEAQGDGDDIADRNYIALPAKVAMVFPPFSAAPAPAPSSSVRATAPAAVLASPSVAAAPVASVTNWGLQVGAYNDDAVGRQALAAMARNMPDLVGRSDQILQKVTSGDGAVVYRARFMGMEQRAARAICAAMVKRGQNCLVVAPEQVQAN